MLLIRPKKTLPPARRLASPAWEFRSLFTLLLLLAGLFVSAANPLAYDKKISGKVTDGTGAGLPGVSIALKGTSSGTVTNGNGEYAITVPDDNAVLIFSFIGYNPQEITVGTQTRIDVVLTSSAKGL
ncbi:MAG: carboxypeptidase-like regulatory domain-containing protein, partial [Chitinophaga sp.]